MPCSTLRGDYQRQILISLGKHNEAVGRKFDILGIVNPEKVRIKNRLYRARDAGDEIETALCEIAIQPVGNIQSPVSPQRE